MFGGLCGAFALSYLHPPPSPNIPVVVHKDFGGLVSEYKAMTEVYRRQNREVRLHECRSACTLALSLPNVCVYPRSVLRFHSAYHRDTRQVDPQISAELLSHYPPAVRQRLGNHLTRHYRSLSGQELIDLGVRDCTQPPETMVARARQTPVTTVAAAPGASGDSQEASVSPAASLVGGVRSMLGLGSPQPSAVMPAQRPALVASLPIADAPPPPPRPRAVADDEGGRDGVLARLAPEPPEPPRRPDRIAAREAAREDVPSARLPRLMLGAQPILPTHFTAYAALR